MKRLSIIIPVYNVEKYVERCLRSLEDQDIPRDDYEIICINDGSPDNCHEVIMHLKKEFGNIILIDQDNQGVSRARNNGIEIATGLYLLFIDPDDYVDNNNFARIIKNADRFRAQVSFLGFNFLNKEGSIQKTVVKDEYKEKLYPGIEAYHMSRGDGRTDPDRTWAVLFEREFLNRNNLRFLPDVPYLEDGEFIARTLCLTERCIFDVHSFYQRTTRPGSATNSNLFQSEKAINGFLLAACNLKRFQNEQNLSEKQIEFLNQPICKFTLLSLISSMNNISIFRKTVEKLKVLNLGKCQLKSCNNFYRIEGFLYNISAYLFLFHRKMRTPLLRIVRP